MIEEYQVDINDSESLLDFEINNYILISEQFLNILRFFCQKLFSKIRKTFCELKLESSSEQFLDIKNKLYNVSFRYKFLKNSIYNLIEQHKIFNFYQKISLGNIYFLYNKINLDMQIFPDDTNNKFNRAINNNVSINHKFFRFIFEQSIFKNIKRIKSKTQ